MNEDELEIAKAAAEGTAAGLTRSFHEIVLNLAEPASLEMGAEFGDVVRGWRLARAVEEGRRWISVITKRGLPRRRVPVKVLMPPRARVT